MRPVIQSRQLDAADPNGIALDQQLGAAGDLTLNGAFVTAGVAILDQQRHVELESAGNISATNFTVTGTDEQGRIISETIAGPNAGLAATSPALPSRSAASVCWRYATASLFRCSTWVSMSAGTGR